MKVFADLHHGDLYWSLHRLFEERLGWELYRPIGFDWFHEGYWKLAEPYGNDMCTVGQYLDPGKGEWDQYKKLNGVHYMDGEVYRVYEPVHDYYQRAITLKTFKSMKFDVILSSFIPHDHVYNILRDTFQPSAKRIAQVGNTAQQSTIPNIMYSVLCPVAPGQNAVYYHQELDMRLYKYEVPNPDTKNIYSIVNCAPYLDVYHQYKGLLTEATWGYWGADCPDGSLFGARGVAEKMIEANIGWHLKEYGGLGHTAMGWFASGRPTVTNMSEHIRWHPNALPLFEPGVTCHNIEAHSVQENCRLIREMLKPEVNQQYADRARRRFNDIINYEEEEKKIRAFLGRLM